MEIGIGIPSGTTASKDAIDRVAEAAEELNFGAIWSFERVIRPVAEVPSWDGTLQPLPEVYKTVYDAIDSLAYVAAKTTKPKLGTAIVDALFQSPPQLGKRFATLDQLSNGRVLAGLGQGSMEAEFIATDTPLKRRGAGFEEYLRALKAVWGPDPVSFNGRFYKIPASNINPKPVQANGIPLIYGGGAPAAVERAARLMDGIMPVLYAWQSSQATVRAFLDAAQSAGRDPSKLHIVGRLNTAPEANPHIPFGGSLEQIQEDVAHAKEIGFTLIFWDMGWANLPAPEQVKWMEKLRNLFD